MAEEFRGSEDDSGSGEASTSRMIVVSSHRSCGFYNMDVRFLCPMLLLQPDTGYISKAHFAACFNIASNEKPIYINVCHLASSSIPSS